MKYWPAVSSRPNSQSNLVITTELCLLCGSVWTGRLPDCLSRGFVLYKSHSFLTFLLHFAAMVGRTAMMSLMASRGRQQGESLSSCSLLTSRGLMITTWTCRRTRTSGTPGSLSSGSTASSAGWRDILKTAPNTTRPAPVSGRHAHMNSPQLTWVWVHEYLDVCPFINSSILSLYLFVCVYISPSIRPSTNQLIYSFNCSLFIQSSILPLFYLLIHPSIHPSIQLSVNPKCNHVICPFIHLYTNKSIN